MTADAAHVAAVVRALVDERMPCRVCSDCATVAVETLTPLIRAQERAKAAAEIRATCDGTPTCRCEWFARIAEGT